MDNSDCDRVKHLMKQASKELDCLREAVLRRDAVALEAHSGNITAHLAEMRQLLSRGRPKCAGEFSALHASILRCSAVIQRTRRTVNALLGLHQSWHLEINGPLEAGR